MFVRNPILPGLHPDPSICREGDQYFLVTSSFTMCPGLPVHRSIDLKTWELVGHVLEGDSWVSLEGFDSSDGVWAPTIRHHNGRFYVVFTLAKARTGVATFVCTATDPAGPWTRTEVAGADGIDPSLFFDDDGSCWFTAARDATSPEATGSGEIWLQAFDPETLSLVGDKHILWYGAVGGAWVEAPHIFKRRGEYHLIAAEGGTERCHAVTAARASGILGPWRTDPRSPLLTHRHLGASESIQNVGHGDIVDGPDGLPWGVVLAVRPVDGFHTLGRETFLVPMAWEDEGPVFAPGTGKVVLGGSTSSGAESAEWVSLRAQASADVVEDEITLRPSPDRLESTGVPAFLARRQADHSCTFEATVAVPGAYGAEVGVFAFQNERHHAGVRIQQTGDGAFVQFVVVEGGEETVTVGGRADSAVRMRIVAERTEYRFEARTDDGPQWEWGLAHSALSTEAAGGFVGVLLGIVHTAPASASPALFRGVRYRTSDSTSPLSDALARR